jgi:hypothetical protein
MVRRSNVTRSRNTQKGNMLIFACVAMAVLALGTVIAFSFGGLFFVHNRLQTACDEIALSGARKLNDRNRLGQMNDMVARSRQLVFATRQQQQQVESLGNAPLLEKMSLQLTNEARQSAIDLDGERQRLTDIVESEANSAMQAQFDTIKGSFAMVLPWLRVDSPALVLSNAGTVANMQSSAHELEGLDDLVQKDRSCNLVVSGNPVNLYKAGQPIRLSSADSDLPFCLSPLPAPVKYDMAPARTVLPEKFEFAPAGYAPCATKVELSIKVATGIGPSGQGDIRVTSAAASTGGGLWQ